MKNIIVALVLDGDEKRVIDHAVSFAGKFNANLMAVHVNDIHAGEMSMMMDSPVKYKEEDIYKLFCECGYESIVNQVQIKLLASETITSAIADVSEEADLLIIGHRHMSTFKSNFMDSIDEGIVNLVKCPVLVVQK